MGVGSDRWISYGGLLVAVLGFGITRFFVAEALRLTTPLSFLLAGVVPLSVGFGLTVYGVALAVGAFSPAYVRAVTRWCLLGTVGMSLVLFVTSIDPLLRGAGLGVFYDSQLLVANVLLGGAVGGVLVGDRSAANRRQRREIRRQANRSLLLNRLLRHEVINAVTVVKGHADLLEEAGTVSGASVEAIRTAAERIDRTIDVVGRLTDDEDGSDRADVAALFYREIEAARSQFPGVEVAFDGPTGGIEAAATDRLGMAFRELLSNAAEDAESSRIEAAVETRGAELAVSIADDGSGLPRSQRELLVSGAFPEYDDPSAGFGLQIVRLLVIRYDGRIEVDDGIDGRGTTITVTLPRSDVPRGRGRGVAVSFPNLYRASLAGILAGVAMGSFFALVTDLLPVIGALYGVENPIMGWVTHLFHSIVFALLFAAGYSYPAVRERVRGPVRGGLAGLAWGTVLWLVAAGLIMPVWLRVVGIPASLPNLPNLGFTSHAIWGSVLGISYVTLVELDPGPDPFPSRESSRSRGQDADPGADRNPPPDADSDRDPNPTPESVR